MGSRQQQPLKEGLKKEKQVPGDDIMCAIWRVPLAVVVWKQMYILFVCSFVQAREEEKGGRWAVGNSSH